MDQSESNGLLGASSVFTGIFLFLSITNICLRTASPVAIIRFFSLIPYGIYGGTAIKHSFKYRPNSEFLKHIKQAEASEGMHGIFGVVLIAYTFIIFIIMCNIKGTSDSLKWSSSSRERRGLYFWIVFCDWVFVVGLAVALGLEQFYVPWSIHKCFDSNFDDPILGDLPVTSLANACRGRYTIKVMALLTILNVGMQSFLLVPGAVFPSLFRASHRLLARHSRPWLYKPIPEALTSDYEKRPDLAYSPESPHPLAHLFQNEKIATNVAKQLHFRDVLNMCGVSKELHETTQYPNGNDESTTKEKLFQMACEDGSKSQCWGCSIMVCNGCAQIKKDLPRPRTTPHLTDCYAVCTSCYLLRVKTQPAPMSATWNATDLSVQHTQCAHDDTKVRPKTSWMHLCYTCSQLDGEAVAKMVEDREMRAMARLMSSRMRCKQCEITLAKGKKRWWICSSGNHECHWAGHEFRV